MQSARDEDPKGSTGLVIHKSSLYEVVYRTGDVCFPGRRAFLEAVSFPEHAERFWATCTNLSVRYKVRYTAERRWKRHPMHSRIQTHANKRNAVSVSNYCYGRMFSEQSTFRVASPVGNSRTACCEISGPFFVFWTHLVNRFQIRSELRSWKFPFVVFYVTGKSSGNLVSERHAIEVLAKCIFGSENCFWSTGTSDF